MNKPFTGWCASKYGIYVERVFSSQFNSTKTIYLWYAWTYIQLQWESETHDGFIWPHLFITYTIQILTSFYVVNLDMLLNKQPGDIYLIRQEQINNLQRNGQNSTETALKDNKQDDGLSYRDYLVYASSEMDFHIISVTVGIFIWSAALMKVLNHWNTKICFFVCFVFRQG